MLDSDWGGIAVIESHLSEMIHFLKMPGIPLCIDIALLALVYLAIGFYFKNSIRNWLTFDNRKYDVITVIVAVTLIGLCIYNYWGGRRLYSFDMKVLQYKSYILAVIIPCAFGLVLSRLCYWIAKIRVLEWMEQGLCYIGQMTLPIMFIHMPLNHWKYQGHGGNLIYVLIGVGGPVIFTLLFNRYKVMRKIFGLPLLSSQ